MGTQFTIYKENYMHLPQRFQNKIERDMDYLLTSEIPGLESVYIFGSCARGDIRSGSDVDILVVTKEKLEDRVLTSNIRCTLDEEIQGVHTDIVFMNTHSLGEDSAFKRKVNKDKKIILEVAS